MEVLYPRCCGLDVPKERVTACRLLTVPDGRATQEVRTFRTLTDELLRLGDWLAEPGVAQVAMESTGVSWQPVCNLLEDRFALLLVNAAHGKAGPGRATDVRDAGWLADLLRHGLLRAGFVPDRPQRERRERTRDRTSLVRARAAEANRLRQTLEGANVKRGDVASDVLGVSGRAMQRPGGTRLAAGEPDPAARADLARGKLREKPPQLERALAGRVGAPPRFLLGQRLAPLAFLDDRIAQVEAAIAARRRPFADAAARLTTIPGVGRTAAESLLAELGTDLGRFPPAGPLASWAGGARAATRAPARPGEEGRDRGRAQHPRHRRPPTDGGDGLRGPGRHLLRRARPRPGAAPAGAAPRGPGRPRLPPASRRRLTVHPRFSEQPARSRLRDGVRWI
jgi:transposase